jgi:flagellar basal body-associated protein FliL
VDEDDGSIISPRDRLIIIIISVVIGVFIIVAVLIFVVKCAMRNALSKDDYMNVKYSEKPAQI